MKSATLQNVGAVYMEKICPGLASPGLCVRTRKPGHEHVLALSRGCVYMEARAYSLPRAYDKPSL